MPDRIASISPSALINGKIPPPPDGGAPIPQAGTPLAIDIDTSSGVPSRSVSAGSGWGGARNSRRLTSDELAHTHALNIIEAARHALVLGLPLNRHITIHWELAGVPDRDAAAATGSYITLLRDLIRKRGGELAHVWVRENGSGKGSHVHILAHIPTSVAFGALHKRWLKNITGRPYVARTISTKRIGWTLAAAQAVTEGYLVNLGEVVAYILKGVSAATGAALGLERLEPGGCIIGKRCATSQNVGRAARNNKETTRGGPIA